MYTNKKASAKATNSAKSAKATNSAKSASSVITDIRIFPINNKKSNCCAMVSITLANVFCISGIKIMDGSKGLFVAMPSAKNKKDEWHDICYPITKEFRKVMSDSILNEFDALDEDDDDESEDD
jgi:stage V sporulation protein G